MQTYETTLVFRRELTPQQVDTSVKKYEKLLTENGGKLHRVENWGLLSLAYPIKKNTKAYYVMISTDTDAAALVETNRQIALDADILRSLNVRLEAPSDKPSPMMRRTKEQGERTDA